MSSSQNIAKYVTGTPMLSRLLEGEGAVERFFCQDTRYYTLQLVTLSKDDTLFYSTIISFFSLEANDYGVSGGSVRHHLRLFSCPNGLQKVYTIHLHKVERQKVE